MINKKSIKSITLKKLIALFVAVTILLILLVAYNFQQLTLSAMRDKGRTIANFVEASLTSHMSQANRGQKQQYLDNIKGYQGLSNLRVIRSPLVNKQFSLPSQERAFSDELIADVFQHKKAHFIISDLHSKELSMHVIIPYLAQKRERIDCMSCHNVPKNSVLGVIDFEIDMSNYRTTSLEYLYVILLVLVFVLISIVYLFFHIIDKHVKYPLEILIKNTKNSYLTHRPMQTDNFESMELEEVAQKINEFNQDVIDKHEELEIKNSELIALNTEIESTQKEIIYTLGFIGEARSKETANHVLRVGEYSYLLAKKYGLSEKECELIQSAAPMHDIGKVGIPDSILNKPGKLTDEEFEIMSTHSEIGHDIFKGSQRKLLKAASIISYEHHEKFNGRGYPQGLKGDDIHIYGRIVALADVFDALGTQRVYKDAWSMEKILELLKKERGEHFDPKLVDLFFDNMDEILSIRERYA